MYLGIAEKTHLFMGMLGGGRKKANLTQSRLEVSIIDKILHAEVVPQPYVAPPA